MAEVQIVESRKLPSLRPERRGQMDTMIVYMLDGKRESTFVTIVPSATPSDAEISAAIRTDLATRQAHLGKRLTI